MANRPGSTLIFAAGTYANLTGPVLELGPAHSGSGAKHPTTFAAAPGAAAQQRGRRRDARCECLANSKKENWQRLLPNFEMSN